MKITLLWTAVVLVFTLTIGCASKPKQEKLEQEYIFQNSLSETNRAAVDAMAILGFGIEKITDKYIQGYRPRRGMVISSGGENVGVWLESISDQETGVKVDTAKSLMGIAGQQDWDDEIIVEMKKLLAPGS